MEGSEDLRYAKIVAQYLGTKHTEIIVTEDEFFNAIPEVIKAIESYDTTSVRASVGNYLLGKYIAKHSDAKVIFNGDGSDELAGGYLYFHASPSDLHFDSECKRLLSDIHAFDVLRSDKSISSHGLEPRTPFLDRGWVDYYLSIPAKLRNHNNKGTSYHEKSGYEKFIIRLIAEQYLPAEVAWRRKEAFSDGVSGQKSWYQIIQERMEKVVIDENAYKYEGHNKPKTREQIYYRTIFDEAYPNCEEIVPYFWMPKWVESKDASARTLSIYNKLNKIE
jgi:asparagine synthase (glutamine-hydrolysing)